MKKLILCDIDGTLVETLQPWLDAIAGKTGVRATIDDITQWDLGKCSPLTGVNPADIYDFLEDAEFLAGLQPIPGAPEVIRSLMDAGHVVLFPTARRGVVSIAETFKWFRRYMPFVDVRKQLIFIGDKYHLRADIIIDDKGETLLEYGAHHPQALLLGIEYPHNRFVRNDPLFRAHKFSQLFPRVPDVWTRIHEHIRAYANLPEPREFDHGI